MKPKFILFLLLFCPVIYASSYDFIQNNIGYLRTGGNGYKIEKCLDPNLTSINIPTVVNGYTVTKISPLAFSDCSALEFIQLPDSITLIGDYAFENCQALNTIMTHTYYDFDTIHLPHSLTSISFNAFYNCTSIRTLDFTSNNALISIGDSAFENCTALDYVMLPNSLISIGNKTFSNCSLLFFLNLPRSLEFIGNEAFANCSRLERVFLPCFLNFIGDAAFLNCSSLVEIEFPQSLTSIGSSAFSGCALLNNIILPDRVEAISSDTFNGCHLLSNITLPSSLLSLDYGAFTDCFSLGSISVPPLLEMFSEPFINCPALSSIYFAGDLLFWPMPSMLGIDVASNCTVYHPKDAVGFSDFMMYGYNLVELTDAPGNIKYVKINNNDCAIQACLLSGLNQIVIPEKIMLAGKLHNVTKIIAAAFADQTSLTDISLPNSIRFIGDGIFAGCSSIATINLPAFIRNIQPGTFAGCNALTNIMISANVQMLGDGSLTPFDQCSSLHSMYFAYNAPDVLTLPVVGLDVPNDFTIYYQKGMTGFDRPEFDGYNLVAIPEPSLALFSLLALLLLKYKHNC